MSLGLLSARAAGSPDPTVMLAAIGLGGWGALLIAVATVTTNFVNVYLSALAWKSLFPRSDERVAVWLAGGVGALLGLLSRAWLDRYADFMLVLGTALVPVGGVLLARFFLVARQIDVAGLYEPPRGSGVAWTGLVAWGLGAVVYGLPGIWGGTLPSLAIATVTYAVLDRAAGGGRSR